MNEYYERTFPITSTETDLCGNLRPAALLCFLQDMATDHAEILEIEREYLMKEYHAIWMLVRTWYKLNRPLKMGEVLRIKTWHRGAKSVTVYRDFDLFVGEEQVGEAVAAWVIADMDNRKMLRSGSVERMANSPTPEAVKDKQLRPIRTPQDRQVVYTKTVRLSDLDVNAHMNNTKYADVMLDALSIHELQGHFISEMQLNYSLECRVGEQMDVSRADTDKGLYIDGCSPDGVRRFEALVQMQPEG